MRIVLSGGGTAGHVLPHTAVIKALKKREKNLKVLYIGSKNGPERALVQGWGWDYVTIPVGKFRRYLDWRHLIDPFKVVAGILKSMWILKQFNPKVIFSKGGYASVPVILAGWIMHVPIVIHDSDAIPGLTTKLAARFTKSVCLGYKEAAAYLPKSVQKKVVVTGIPIREEVFKGNSTRGLKITGFNREKSIVLVMGGSLGAASINEALWAALPKLLKHCQVVHITGDGKAPSKTMQRKIENLEGYRMFEYIELPDLYAISDLIVSRAGANSIAEINALQKPSILIPLGLQASHGDQIENAKIMARQSNCAVILDDALTGKKLEKEVKEMLGDSKLLQGKAHNASLNAKAGVAIAKVLCQI